MLFDRWKQVVKQNRGEFALCDAGSGQRWTFAELDCEAERASSTHAPIVYAQGSSYQFILQVINAWKERRVLCPLDPGQTPPRLERWPPECVHLKVTSATAGPPKIVAFSAEQLEADVENIAHTMGLRPEWPNLAGISLAHSYGFSNLILPLLLKGIPLVLLSAPLPETFRHGISEFGSVTIPAVPALWRTWLESGVLSSAVKLAISAGAPLPIQLEEQVFARTGLKIHNFYGASECGGIAYDRTSTPRSDGSMVGQAMNGVDISTTDAGTLVVKSGAVGLGYLPESSPTLGAGKFETSDLAEINAGEIFLKGRLGESINVAGRKIAPESIEAVLRQHPSVKECVVFGVASPEAERTEKVVACVAGDKVSETELKVFLSSRLPGWQIPREFWFLREIATNARGKLSRAEWRRKFLER